LPGEISPKNKARTVFILFRSLCSPQKQWCLYFSKLIWSQTINQWIKIKLTEFRGQNSKNKLIQLFTQGQFLVNPSYGILNYKGILNYQIVSKQFRLGYLNNSDSDIIDTGMRLVRD